MTELTQAEGTSIAETRVALRPTPLPYLQLIVIGLAIALVSPFTGLAWPFAILTGIVIGRSQVDASRGLRRSTGAKVAAVLAVTGGVLAMMFFGVVLGGLIGFVVVALAALAERRAADASPTDRVVARVLIVVVAVVGWLALLAIGLRIDVRLGG